MKGCATVTERRLPKFLVIGAEKAATTWISHQLRHHPRLWLPNAEPHFFSREFHRGLDWYEGLFADAPPDRIVGEKSADYFAHEHSAARIADILPDAPMIVQLRNPVDRAYSDYCMYFRRGLVDADLSRHLDPRRVPRSRFLEGSLYARHLTRLRDRHPDAKLKVLLYEDIKDHPERVIGEVCRHIGIEVHIAPDAVSGRQNDSRSPMLPLALRRALAPARPWLDPLRSNRWLARMRSLIARPVQYPELTTELRSILQDYYAKDVEALKLLLGRDVSHWACRKPVMGKTVGERPALSDVL
jgi:hypothetical protein